MKKELMRRIVNVTKNEIILEEVATDDSVSPTQMDLIKLFNISKDKFSKRHGYREYNSNCYQYIHSSNELILDYIMWFIL